ncbi:MAG: hypothetical protein WBB28_09475 [Crinalium sp.]
MKQQMNMLTEKIENIKLQRQQIKVQIETEGLSQDRINLAKARVTTKVTHEGFLTEQHKLTGAKFATQSAAINADKTGDKVKFDQADRLLSQQEMMSKLQLKSISVASLREDVRHQAVITGNTPKVAGFNAK